MRETVGLIGGPETGKTTWLLQIAKNNPSHPVYIFDTEGKVERVAAFLGGVPDNVLVMHTPTLDEMQYAKREIVVPALRNCPDELGIVMYDMVGNVWTEAQEKFAGLGHKDGLGAHLSDQMAKLREQNKNAMTGGFEGFQGDWKTIRGWYNYVVKNTITHMACHVFLTAGSRPIRQSDGNSPVADRTELLDVWNPFGYAPEAEKGLTFQLNTMLGVKAWGLVRAYSLSLAKDVSRVPLLPVELWLEEDTEPSELIEFTLKSGKSRKVPIFDLWEQYCELTEGSQYLLPGGVNGSIEVKDDGTWNIV